MFKALSDLIVAIFDLAADKVLPLCSILAYLGLFLLVASLGLGFALPVLPFALSFKGLVKLFLIGRYGKPLLVAVKDDLVGILGKF